MMVSLFFLTKVKPSRNPFPYLTLYHAEAFNAIDQPLAPVPWIIILKESILHLRTIEPRERWI